MALGLVALSFAVSAGLCVAGPAVCAAVGACWIGPGGTRGTSADAAGRRGGDLADDGRRSGAGLLAVYALGPAELPEPLARHAGGVFQQAGELIWILVLATRDHGHGVCGTTSKTSTGGSGWAFSSPVRACWPFPEFGSRCSGRSPIRCWAAR